MNQKDVAFALGLVARALSGRIDTDPEASNDISLYTLEDVARELTEYAGKLKAAPVQSCAHSVDHWGEPGPCIAHPLGGPDCVAKV